MTTTNQLSSPLSVVRYLHMLQTVPNKDAPSKETIGTGNNSRTTFWLDNLGILEDTYTIYYGSNESTATALTETTHYTIDLDLSKVTLTASGVSTVGADTLYAAYSYNTINLLNSELLSALNAAESRVIRDTEQTFAEYSDTNPNYKKISDELKKGHYVPYDKVYDMFWTPLVKLQPTTNGAYTTGGTTITLTSASGFPTTGTIYIGGNKVSYTGKSGNDLTVPSTTPSIADDATVRGEVIEVSMTPESSLPSYTVLDPDTEYEIDYDQGRVKILNNAYWGEIAAEDRVYPANYLVNLTYMHAWHELSENPEIPDEIEWVVNAIAARKLMGSVVAKAHSEGMNDFNPSLIDVDKEAIQEVLDGYATLNVGTSMYNKQSLS